MYKRLSDLFLHTKLIIFPLAQRGFLNFLPDSILLRIMYWARFSKKLNLVKPGSYNEAIQYLKIHDRNPYYTTIVDKYSVRDMIREAIGERYLVPLIGIYNSFDEIEWEKFPQRFILKCTHGTHCSMICMDKRKFNYAKAKQNITAWLKHNYYYDAREWPYKEVVPRVMVERLVDLPEEQELLDIKVMCFGGKPAFIVVHRNITNEEAIHTINLFTTNWTPINVEWDSLRYDGIIKRPNQLDRILKLAEKLSAGYPHIRVDFMLCGDELYFGELTLYPGAGFKPFSSEAFDKKVGKLINLENVYDKNGHK